MRKKLHYEEWLSLLGSKKFLLLNFKLLLLYCAVIFPFKYCMPTSKACITQQPSIIELGENERIKIMGSIEQSGYRRKQELQNPSQVEEVKNLAAGRNPH